MTAALAKPPAAEDDTEDDEKKLKRPSLRMMKNRLRQAEAPLLPAGSATIWMAPASKCK